VEKQMKTTTTTATIASEARNSSNAQGCFPSSLGILTFNAIAAPCNSASSF
jgi:hypothetical protein